MTLLLQRLRILGYFVPEILHIIGKAEVIQNRERNEKGMRWDREKEAFSYFRVRASRRFIILLLCKLGKERSDCNFRPVVCILPTDTGREIHLQAVYLKTDWVLIITLPTQWLLSWGEFLSRYKLYSHGRRQKVSLYPAPFWSEVGVCRMYFGQQLAIILFLLALLYIIITINI